MMWWVSQVLFTHELLCGCTCVFAYNQLSHQCCVVLSLLIQPVLSPVATSIYCPLWCSFGYQHLLSPVFYHVGVNLSSLLTYAVTSESIMLVIAFYTVQFHNMCNSIPIGGLLQRLRFNLLWAHRMVCHIPAGYHPHQLFGYLQWLNNNWVISI